MCLLGIVVGFVFVPLIASVSLNDSLHTKTASDNSSMCCPLSLLSTLHCIFSCADVNNMAIVINLDALKFSFSTAKPITQTQKLILEHPPKLNS